MPTLRKEQCCSILDRNTASRFIKFLLNIFTVFQNIGHSYIP